MSIRVLTVVRFALYALTLAALVPQLWHHGEGDSATRLAGTTSQGNVAAISFDGDHVRWIGVNWEARCTHGWVLGPYLRRYFPADLEQRGRHVLSSKPDPTVLAHGQVTMRLDAVVHPGTSAHGTFSAITRGPAHDGTPVRCRTGVVRWSASRPY